MAASHFQNWSAPANTALAASTGLAAALSFVPRDNKTSFINSARLRSVMSRTKPNTRSLLPVSLDTLIST